jgi:hypothetical protein
MMDRAAAVMLATVRHADPADDFDICRDGIVVPCRVLDGEGVDGSEASSAENVVRQDVHPADQFEAFHALARGRGGQR